MWIALILLLAVVSAAPQAMGAGPQVSSGGILNASGVKGIAPASPGSLMSIYGSDLSTTAAAAALGPDGRLPLALGGAEVLIAGRPAALLYASPGQINAQVPFEVPLGPQPVIVRTAAGASPIVTLQITATSPGIFAGAVIRNDDSAVISQANPARPGDVLVIYCTGLGGLNLPLEAGQPAPAAPLAFPSHTPTA